MTTPHRPTRLPPSVRLRPLREADIPAGVALCRASRWNQTAREWELVLHLAPGGAIAADRDGTVVGTAVTVPYDPGVGWVALVLVDPAERGRGIGRALLNEALSRAPAGHALRLDATPAGRRLYATLGFRDEFGLARLRRQDVARAAAPATVAPLDAHDWAEIAALDRRVFGADRRAVLEWCWHGAPELAWMSRAGGHIDGFALGRHGHDTEHVGPIVAAAADVACDLAAACLSRVTRPAVSIDVPDTQDVFRRWLCANGFEVERPFTRMIRGALGEPGLPAQVFAVVGPEFG